MRRASTRAAAVMLIAMMSCGTADVQAQVELKRCTGQVAPALLDSEQTYLDMLHAALGRLSNGEANVIPGLERLLDTVGNHLRKRFAQNMVGALSFARSVDLALEGGGEVVRDVPALAAAWARFRLTFARLLRTGDCLREAEQLLTATRSWLIAETPLSDAVIASQGALLIQLGRLDEAIVTLSPFEKSEGAPQNFTTLRARSAALSNLATGLRQSGERTRAAQIYRQALLLMLAPKSVEQIRTSVDRATYEADLATLYLNLATLSLYNQETESTWTYLQKARDTLQRAGQIESETMVSWFRIAADYWLEIGNKDIARDTLRQGLALVERIAPISAALRSELSRRLARLGVAEPEMLRQLHDNERALDRRDDADWYAKVKSAEALSEAYTDLQDWERALEWSRIAYARMQRVAGGPTVELALSQQKLSFALANRRQIMDAYQMSRAAARTLREVGEREAVGCRVAQERNASLVKLVREWHGILSSLLLQQPGIERTPIANDIANEVLGLVQAREMDRFGAAALRAALRSRVANRSAVRVYETILNEKCALEAETIRIAAAQVDQASLASTSRRLAELEGELDAALAELDPILAATLSGGRAILTRDELAKVLRPGEAMLAFRIGGKFSVASLNLRQGEGLTTATIPLPDATFEAIEAAVAKILAAIEAREPIGPATQALSDLLRVAELQPLLMEADHLFVVPDGHLQRLPSHLLPIGTARLGDVVPSSTIASIWGFSGRRQLDRTTVRSRAVYAIGAPELHHISCDLDFFPPPEGSRHREVMCLGKPGGLVALLRSAQEILGGPPPVTGADATRAAIMGAAPEEAGILLFGTHGVIPETKEISYLVEPALVLSPSQSDPEEDGLLLASQVTALRLDYSWLAILAACRTGTPSGTDVSDGLTGLALGFTAAGTDALLVTQWSVYPDAAREVVLTMLQRMAADPELTLSAALDDAMRAHMETHPDTIEWAGFTILGDGTVTMPPL
jgi:hypothetical protein